MADKVNLDALIPREDFEIIEDSTQSLSTQTIQIRDLEKEAFFYPVLRKPDFQRETGDWTPQKISDFVISFLNGDLIPAIILWHSGHYIFVIDGSHRLSALMAWVHDDYGDGEISRSFFEHRIPDEQIKAAEQTRRLISQKIDSFKEHKFATKHPDRVKPAILERAKRLASLALQLQWVKGDAEKAEQSFFKINQQAAPIDKTELRLLKARRKPNALAARAIVRSGTGHKYWSKFPDEQQKNIQESAKEINSLLFNPPLKTPIKTLDLPVAGRGYSSQTIPLVFDFVNLVNDVQGDKEIPDDPNGEKTITFLENAKRISYRMCSNHPSSLGLHPAVYFYSAKGRYQPTSFLGMVGLIKQFENEKYFDKFTKNRKKFEEFFLKYKSIPNQVTFKHGSGVKGFHALQTIFKIILDQIDRKKSEANIIKVLSTDKKFSYLVFDNNLNVGRGRDFTTEVKSAAFLRDALKAAVECKICGGLIHRNAISIDHIQRKEDGGVGTLDNAQLSHPYCNTTFKN